jgi:transposase InsO family protein
MRTEGLVACQPRPYRATTTPDAAAAATADLVARDFTADAPGVKLVGDITYIPTWHGWLYLATVIDCHTKAVVGWSMASRMHASLVTDAIAMAAGNIQLQPGCVFHSDRGSQYTSAQYRTKLDELDVLPSVGRTGVCWDNALAESFFATLKNELVHRTVFPTRRHARRAIVSYIEGFYNRRRLHSALGYRTPLEVHTAYENRQLAAQQSRKATVRKPQGRPSEVAGTLQGRRPPRDPVRRTCKQICKDCQRGRHGAAATRLADHGDHLCRHHHATRAPTDTDRKRGRGWPTRRPAVPH